MTPVKGYTFAKKRFATTTLEYRAVVSVGLQRYRRILFYVECVRLITARKEICRVA